VTWACLAVSPLQAATNRKHQFDQHWAVAAGERSMSTVSWWGRISTLGGAEHVWTHMTVSSIAQVPPVDQPAMAQVSGSVLTSEV